MAPSEEPRQPPHRGPSRLGAAASRLGSLLTAPEDSDAWLAVGDGEDASPHALKGSPTATADGSHGHSDRLKSAEEGAEDGLQLEGKPAPRGAATFGTHHGVLVSEDTFKQAHEPPLATHVMLYHAAFLFVLAVNLPLIILTARDPGMIQKGDNGSTGLIVLCFGVLMRSEIFLTALYWVVCHVGRYAPKSVRYWLAQMLYHAPGGLHAGCGVAGFAWEAVYAFQWWLLPPSEGGAGPGLIDEPYAIVCAITAIFLFVMLGVMCVLSVPYVRRNHHNLFELSHRYVGWALLGILWIHVTVKAAYWANYNALGQELPQSQKASWGYVMYWGVNTWAAVALSVLVWHPWLFVRKRTATATVMGQPGRPACLILSGFRGHAPAGTWGRLSTWWPGQWHPFAVVSPPRREEGGGNHSMLIAPAGDWTKARIREAEAANGTAHQYYVRLLRAPGFMYTTRMWRSIVCVASGAGIAPVLPVVLQRAAPSIFVVWITSRPETFGPVQSQLESALPPGQLWIHDTATQGRPDAVDLAVKAVRKEKAEAMYIVANIELTFKVVRGCRAIGVRSFGAIWDS